MTENFLIQAVVYLLAAVVSVPIAKRLGLGSVLGYLLAGIAIGPYVLHLVGTSGGDVMHYAEFGVVMMLFLVGLELRPALLWELRGPILGLGGAQVACTTLAVALAGMAVGLDWRASLATGMILAMSSTAIVLQSLNEKGLLKTPGGQACFSVLLFQDISVIPILALMPLLVATSGPSVDIHRTGIDALPGWLHASVVLGAVASIIFAGRFLLRPIFRYIAETNLREVFTATTLLLVVGITALMEMVGLSAALGTFVAGVVLAESEYRHQLEADIEPFKGLLLGLFFIAVGSGIDFSLLFKHPILIASLVIALVVIKFAVLNGLGRLFKLELSQNYLFSFALAQGGEFAFVLISFATGAHVITQVIAGPLIVTVAISMAITPLLLIVNERLVQPRFAKGTKKEREADVIDEHDHPVIIAGFGRFGHVIGRLLRANDIGTTVLDIDPDQVDVLRKLGIKTFYGDATREDLLRAAGAERAKLFIIAIDDEEKILALVEMVQKEFPHLTIMTRATSRAHAYDLLDKGVKHIYRETLGSSLDLGVDALRAMGFRARQAERAAFLFKTLDENSVRDLAKVYKDDKIYMSRSRQHIENLENLLRLDAARIEKNNPDLGWEQEESS